MAPRTWHVPACCSSGVLSPRPAGAAGPWLQPDDGLHEADAGRPCPRPCRRPFRPGRPPARAPPRPSRPAAEDDRMPARHAHHHPARTDQVLPAAVRTVAGGSRRPADRGMSGTTARPPRQHAQRATSGSCARCRASVPGRSVGPEHTGRQDREAAGSGRPPPAPADAARGRPGSSIHWGAGQAAARRPQPSQRPAGRRAPGRGRGRPRSAVESRPPARCDRRQPLPGSLVILGVSRSVV